MLVRQLKGIINNFQLVDSALYTDIEGKKALELREPRIVALSIPVIEVLLLVTPETAEGFELVNSTI